MAEPFKPTRPDGRSYRTVCIDFLSNKDHGQVISYTELADELGLNPRRDKHTIQQIVRLANKNLLKLHKRGTENVPTVGYRILEAREHMVAANRHQTKADKALVRALDFYSGADLSRMNDVERKLHHGQQILAQAVYASHQELDKRIRRVEDILKGSATINE